MTSPYSRVLVRRLSDLDPEKRVIRMFVAPPVIFPLMAAVHPMPLTVLLVPLPQIDPISTIFVVVPHMIVVVFPIVIPPFAMVVVVSSRCYRGYEGSSQE